MSRIAPNIEAYGTYARLSALADMVEMQALRRPSISSTDLADYIRDNSWMRLLGETLSVPEIDDEEALGLGEVSDASYSASASVFSLLGERAVVLGDRYPYEFSGERLSYRGRPDLRHAYLLVLGVTVLHAYKIESPLDPRHYFEYLVAECLSQRGLLVGNLGNARRSSSTLREALVEIAASCNLRPNVDATAMRRRAQDEGVDVIAHLSWVDHRPLHWVFIVQATCGKSDTWYNKMGEPSEGMWKERLGLRVLPRAVFAVPHHIPSREALYLSDRRNGQCLIMDRLRLCLVDERRLEQVPELLAAISDIEIEFG